ncbi:hypothetical protein ACVWZZ_005360 [Bradyrhizobium sp. LM6.10]
MILPDGYSDVPNGKMAAVVTHLEMTAPARASLQVHDVAAEDALTVIGEKLAGDVFRRGREPDRAVLRVSSGGGEHGDSKD